MKQGLFYCCLSFVMMGLAISRLTYLMPWVDEVMFMDTPMHYVKGMGWTTFAWYSVAKQDPFLLYPPLYSMVMALWMNIFGTTLIACRSLNIIITMSIGWGLLRICRHLGLKMSLMQVGLLVMLLWCTDDMIYMYSNGRPDLLGAAILVFTISEMINQKNKWSIIFLSVLLLASGIQAVVCLMILQVLAYFSFRDYREMIKKIAVLSVLGTLLGFLLVCAFMACHSHLTAFVVNASSYSDTLMKLAMISLPVAGDYLGIDTALYLEKIANNTTDVPLYCRIFTIYTHPAYVSLLVVALFVFLSERTNLKGTSLYVMMKFLFVCFVSIPLLMNIVGRFPPYYYWMVYLTVFLLVVILAGFTKSRRNHFIIGLASLLLVIRGLICSTQHQDYLATETFMAQCTMLRDRNVVAPFSVFYEMEKLSSNTYYLGVYPPRYLPKDIDYVILPPKGSEYGTNQLYDFYENVNKSDSLQTVVIAESKTAGLKVYKVIKTL